MTLLTPRFRCASAAAASLVLSAAAFAQAKPLAVNLPPGSTVQFQQDVTMDMNMQMNMGGQQIDMKGAVTDSVAGTVTVLEASGGKPTKAQVVFDAGGGTKIDMGGMNQSAPFELAGQTVTATLGPDGSLVSLDPAAGDPATTERVEGVLKFGKGMLPPGPVAPGDTWQPSDASLFGDEMQMQNGSQLELVQFTQVGGREAAEVRLTGDLTGDVQGMQTGGSVGGTMMIDTATGVVLSGDVDGDLSMSASEIQGQQIQVDGSMKLSADSTSTVGGGGAAGAAAAPPAAGGASAAIGGGGGGAPPAVGAAGGDFAGTWSGAELTLVIAEGASPSVQIQRGGQTYTGSITSSTADSFTGSFEAAGSTFPFSGQRTASGVDFTSGSKTYALSRAGGQGGGDPNPLD